jgi:hypothetical protein
MHLERISVAYGALEHLETDESKWDEDETAARGGGITMTTSLIGIGLHNQLF